MTIAVPVIRCRRAVSPRGSAAPAERTPAERRAAMTWMQRRKRVLRIDIEARLACGGRMRIVASVEDSVVIEKILIHLDAQAPEPEVPGRTRFDETR